MAREFFINGESLVLVKGGAHMSGVEIGDLSELGLTGGDIQVVPRFVQQTISTDGFGGEIATEVRTKLADCAIRMTLVHYDPFVLDICFRESTAGDPYSVNMGGELGPAGGLLGNYLPLLSSGNRFISLVVRSPVAAAPWHFPACYLPDSPFTYPLGTGVSEVQVTWQAIPYTAPSLSGDMRTFDLNSSGGILWDRFPPTE